MEDIIWEHWSGDEDSDPLICGQASATVSAAASATASATSSPYEDISEDEGSDFLPDIPFADSPRVQSPPRPAPSPPRVDRRVDRPSRPRSAGAIGEGPVTFSSRRGGPYFQASPRFYQLVAVGQIARTTTLNVTSLAVETVHDNNKDDKLTRI